jgi:hypothetical protein
MGKDWSFERMSAGWARGRASDAVVIEIFSVGVTF